MFRGGLLFKNQVGEIEVKVKCQEMISRLWKEDKAKIIFILLENIPC